MDCGATCIRMISKYYKKNISIHTIRRLSQTHQKGVNLLGISEAAEKLGYRTFGLRLEARQLEQITLPCILHWGQNHFVVLYGVKHDMFYIADPGNGLQRLKANELLGNWFAHAEGRKGVALLLEPTPQFYADVENDEAPGIGWNVMLRYFYRYKNLFVQLVLGLTVGLLLQSIMPFLTQSVVDIGIATKDIGFVNLMLIAQLMLFVGQTSVSFIRSWILLHISTRVSIAVLTDMLMKLMKLPVSFFEMKTHGDIMQRMNDQQRIENFLTGTSLSTLFSLVNLLVFSFVLAYYNIVIFGVFVGSTLLYSLWILLFLNQRRQLDQRRFKVASDNQNTTVELIQGIQEIKLSNSEKQKRWEWEGIQAKLFHYKVDSLALSQYQQAGSMAINQLKNIIITFLSAKAVIDGQMTLGGMMAIQYIIGLVSNPVEQFLSFVQSYQDAKISLERINEIYETADEEPATKDYLNELPRDKSINFRNISFRYYGAGNDLVLEDIDLRFPEGKTTAIVGMSGSGKTTILKLIMRFYQAEQGDIYIGDKRLNGLSFKIWRDACGIVMQEGYLFADTIEHNITIGAEWPDAERLERALRIANLEDFVAEQPFGLKTKIGTGGKGISQGQKQRLLIARAVYKDPHYILFDEATNALDTQNERIIIHNLRQFFHGRTVIIVAHRLSTVNHADNIIVMNHGKVVEQGTHRSLIGQKGAYYELIRNQLELGA